MLTAIRTVHQACSECFIMRLTLVVYLLTLLTLSDLRSPEVYESVDEAATGNTNRTGNFASISQQDRRKWRYLEQQVVDARHQARNRAVKGRKPSALRKRDLNGIHPISLNNALTYVGDKEDQISVLNSLLGKAPLVQLQELQQMLSGKDHTPIIEDVVDIENPLTRPNVKTDPAPPELQEAVANTFAQSQFKHPSYGHVVLVQPRKNSVFRQDNLPYAAEYAFGYNVRDFHSGNDFGHEELHDGKSVRGHYHVLLPDGRLQSVKYFADDTGYHAEVTYDRAGVHPVH